MMSVPPRTVLIERAPIATRPADEHDAEHQQQAGPAAKQDQQSLHPHVRTVMPSASDSR